MTGAPDLTSADQSPSARLRRSERRLRERIDRGDPLWPPQLAVAVAVGLNFALTEKVTVGPTWLLPLVEATLLLVLVPATFGKRVHETAPRWRRFALAVIGLVSLANVASLALLVHYLLAGGKTPGHALIGSGALLLTNNVLLFSIWYWELDGGGPKVRHKHPKSPRDFQFPQMENPQLVPPGWRPGFGDYLYLSLTNATAFSPTDTMPLTHGAKSVMALQSVSALMTIGLVVARAVNILA